MWPQRSDDAFARAAYTPGFTALKTPPTRIGFHVTSTPASAATSPILWNAR